MDFQYGSGVNTQQTNVEIGYHNYNSSGVREDSFVNKGNEGVRDLQQIPVGKAFRGEVTDVVGKQVTIRLDNGQTVQARLAEPVSLNIGEKVLFQVKSNSDGMIEIKPLVNAILQGQEATILKALEAAKMPVNEKTVMLLQNLLKEQMPISRQSIQNLYKQILANSNADIHTIVQMNKHQIPVTKENIGQFEAYKNYEHRIAAEADQLSTELTELLTEVLEENGESGKQFHQQLLQLFTKGENGGASFTQAAVQKGQSNQPELLVKEEQAALTKEILTTEGSTFLAENSLETEKSLLLAGEENIMTNLPSGDQVPKSGENIPFQQGQVGYELSVEERQSILNNLKELPLSEELKSKVLSGEAEVKELLQELEQQLQQNPQFSIEDLIHNDGYKKLLKSQINSRWFVKPQQLAAGEKMEEFYENLKTQTKQLESLIHNLGKENSQAAKTAEGLRENIDFMNQLNQMFTYVQIPLMMSGKTAHSDLYVFTKKKNLRAQEGKVSALLHLELEGLGNLDVYVELDGMNVNTQFKLANEELVAMFESNIDFLIKRITEKGYHFTSKIDVSEEQMDFVEDFLARDHGNTPMQRFAFDVRA